MINNPDLRIGLYEDWMKDQIISLTEKEYPFMQGWFEKRFEALYESSYQQGNNGLFVAAVSGKKVAACISYVKWPLAFNGSVLHSYQMAGLLVDDSMRGKGLFSAVLAALDQRMLEIRPDVVIGFPVEASKNGFLRQGWQNRFNLTWHIKPLFLPSLAFGKSVTNCFPFDPRALNPECDATIQTSPDPGFWSLRENFSPMDPTCQFLHSYAGGTILLIYRFTQKKGIQFALLGKIYSGNATVQDIEAALQAWCSMLRKSRVPFAATAINRESSADATRAVKKLFFRLPRQFAVILKSYKETPGISDPSNWNLMPADMETW